jgi:hypothetical protein
MYQHDFSVDQYGLITDKGKFEREPLFMPYFYEKFLSGDGDCCDADGTVLFFINDDDRKLFPSLADCETIILIFHDNGFVTYE